MTDTRTGAQVSKLVEAIQQDLAEATEHLQKGRDLIERLTGETKGVNGLSSLLKAKDQELQKIISDLRDEAEAVEKKMLGAKLTDTIETSVDREHAERVKEARG